ncbi:MAG TPA: class I SAM-dependent methyltransferase, partial [Pirellulales bacterium]|nr:class I SAM-dependent methyltransferase [Pirellulales bacterium]
MTAFPSLPSLDFFNLEEFRVAMLSYQEQLLLYSLVYALRPKRVLEIGFAAGGSSRTMLAALLPMDHAGQRLVSIDPRPEAVPPWTGDPRFRLVRESSPAAIPRAVELLGGAIDFCFIDADHSEEHVYADSCGVADSMAREGYVLYHDAFYPSVAAGIGRFLRERSDFVDCGLVSRFRPINNPSPWGGLRLLRRVAAAAANCEASIATGTFAQAAPQSAAFVFVCQGGELEVEALLLAASLVPSMPKGCELIAAVPSPSELMSH